MNTFLEGSGRNVAFRMTNVTVSEISQIYKEFECYARGC